MKVIIRKDKNPNAENDDPGPHVCLDSKKDAAISMLVMLDIFSLFRISVALTELSPIIHKAAE